MIQKITKLLFFSVFVLPITNQVVLAQNCTVNAGINQTICINDAFTLVGSKAGLFAGAGTTTWSQVSGPSVIINSPNSLTTSVKGFTAGNTYVFRLIANCQDGTLVQDEVSYTVLGVSSANAGSDIIACPTPPAITLSANNPGAGETGEWTLLNSAPFTNGAGITGDVTSGVGKYNPFSAANLNQSNSGNSWLVWKISNANGCISRDTVVVTNRGGIYTVSAGSDITLTNCYTTTQSTTLNGSFSGTLGGQTGLWTVINGPNIPTLSNPSTRNTGISNLIQGTYTLVWTVSGPCANGSDTMTLTVPAPTQSVTTASASGQTFCDGRTTAVLSGNPAVFTGETVLWQRTSGVGTITNPSAAVTTVTGLTGSGTSTFRYTITNSNTGCSSVVNNVTVNYNTAPGVTINGGNNNIILACGATSASIPYATVGGDITRWRIVSGPLPATSFANTSQNPLIVNSLTAAGLYTIRIERNTNNGTGCSASFDDVNVTVSSQPTGANAGTAQLLACNVTSSALAANIPIVGVGSWTQVSGPNTAVISNIFNNTSPISNLTSGRYTFRWIISGGSECLNTQDDVDVVVAQGAPTASNAGGTRTVCHSTPLILNGNTPLTNETGTWTVIPSTGITFSDVNSPNSTVNGLAANTSYKFIWTIVNTCGISVDTAFITTNNTPGPIASNAGADLCFASGVTSFTLSGNSPSPGTGLWTQISGSPATLASPTSNTSGVSGLTDGKYTFEWAISRNGCTVTRDTVLITISSPVTPSNAGADQNICGSSATLSANTPSIGIGTWSQLNGPGGFAFSDIHSPTASLTSLTFGTYRFVWTISNGSCVVSKDTVLFQVASPPTTPLAGPDQFICSGTSVTLAGNTITAGTGIWGLVNTAPNSPTITNATSPTTTVTGLVSGTYNMVWQSMSTIPYCPIQYDTVTIVVTQPANAGTDQNICNQNTITLRGTTGTIGSWSQVSGPVTGSIVTTGDYTAIATNLTTAGLYQFQYTVPSAGSCPATVDTVNVTISGFGTLPNAGPDTSLCTANTYTMTGNTPIVGIGTWSLLSGPNTPTIVSPNAENTVINGLITGTYIFQWNITNGNCTGNADVMRLTVWNTPTVSTAGADQLLACPTSTNLNGNTPLVGLGNWSQLSGPSTAVINSIITPNTGLGNLIVGTYQFIWTISNGPVCPVSRDTVQISVPALPPTVANAGLDQELCNATTASFAANTISTGTGIWTQLSGPNTSIITTPADSASGITNLTTGAYRYIWTSTSGGCVTSDTMQIRVSSLPTTAVVGNDQSICQFDSLVISANTPTNGSASWSLVSGPNTPFILKSDSSYTKVVGTIPGTYLFSWNIQNGSCPISRDTMEVIIDSIPSLALAGSDRAVCSSSDVLSATAPSIGTGTWSQLSGPSSISFNNVNLPNTALSGLITGVYKLTWLVQKGSCTSIDTLQLTKDSLPTPASAGNDTIMCPINTFQLSGNTPSIGTGAWSRISGPGTAPTISSASNPNAILTFTAAKRSNTVPSTYMWSISNASCPVSRDTVVILNKANCNPIAQNDSFTIYQDQPISLGNTRSNDSDPDIIPIGQSLTTSVIVPPVLGTVTLMNSNGTFNYLPHQTGVDSFRYVLSDNGSPVLRDTAWVYIFIKRTAIGASKEASIPVFQSNNSYRVNYTIVVKNYDTIPLSRMNVLDNLASTFAATDSFNVLSGSVTATGSLSANSSFNGKSDIRLVDSSSSTLGSLLSDTIRFTVDIWPSATYFGPFNNTAFVSATGPTGLGRTTDSSMVGSNPDPNGNSIPNESGENTPTPVTLTPNPVIGIAKSVGTPVLLSNGSYHVPYTIIVKNYGNVVLNNLQLTTAITDNIIAPSSYTLVGAPSNTGTLTLNSSFNGNSNRLMLDSTTSTLARGASDTIRYTINVVPNGFFGTYYTSTVARGRSVVGNILTTDSSMVGSNPDPNGNSIPNESGENTPTPLTLTPNPVIGIAKSVGTPVLLSNGSYHVPYTIIVKNYGNVVLNNLQLTTAITDNIIAPSSYTLVGAPSNTGTLTLNSSFNGNSNRLMLDSTTSTLARGASDTIRYTINVVPNGFFGTYYTSTVARGRSVVGNILTTDSSMVGSNPDPNGNSIPNEAGENTPTPLTLTPNPVIGIAKSVGTPVLQSNGSYHVPYTIIVKNYGNVGLNNLQLTTAITDNIIAPSSYTLVGTPSNTGTLTLNSSFNGSSNRLMLDSTSSVLALGASDTIRYTINVVPNGFFGTYYTSTVARGRSVVGNILTTDSSMVGSNPDPNGNSIPNESGENTPTPLTLTPNPVIGIAKSVGTPVLQSNGSYHVPYTIIVKNYGNVGLNNLQLTTAITDNIIAPSSYTLVSAPSNTGTLTLNSSFNGNSNRLMLDSTSSVLALGASDTIRYTINVVPNGFFGTYYTSTVARGRSVVGNILTTDSSMVGSNPDPNGNDIPNEAGENTPTPVTLTPNPVVGIAKSVGTPVLQSNGSYHVPYTIIVKNYGNVGLNNLQLTTAITDNIIAPSSYTLVGTPSNTGTLTLNSSFNGNSNRLMLDSTSSVLALGASDTIRYTINVVPNGFFGTYYTSTVARGRSIVGNILTTDSSMVGSNPDPNGNSIPNEAGENTPTPVTLTPNPVIGIAKSVGTPVLQSNGSYHVPYTIIVKNYGNVGLNNLQLTTAITDNIIAPSSYTLVNAPSNTGTLTLNSSFNGNSNRLMLDSTTSVLALGASDTIRYTINVVPNGFFGTYYTSTVARGRSVVGNILTTDSSMVGSNPDPNGNDIPNEAGENTPTPVTLTPNPVVGIAKSVGTPVLQSNGSYHVPYTIIVKNYGNVGLNNLQLTTAITDNIIAPSSYTLVGTPSNTGTLTLNSSFNGNSNRLMLDSTSSVLALGASDTIRYTINVVPNGFFGTYYTSTVARGRSIVGNILTTDSSMVGSNPDPNGNSIPNEAGENTPTPVTLTPNPVIGIAKSVGTPVLQSNGSYHVPYTIIVKNYGNVGLNNLQLTTAITDNIIAPSSYTLVNAPSNTGTLTLNSSFNGNSNRLMLDSTTSVLALGASDTIRYTINVVPNGFFGTYYTSTVARGRSVVGNILTTDSSMVGSNPDPNGNDIPNEAGENTPTPVTLTPNPVVGIAKSVGTPVLQSNGSYHVPYTIIVKNYGNVGLNNLQLTTAITDNIIAPSSYTLVSAPSNTGTLTLNSSFNGNSNRLMLDSTSSVLALGASDTIRYTINVVPNGFFGTYYTSTVARGRSVVGNILTTDSSMVGSNPDPNGNAIPNEAGENTPTPLLLIPTVPVIGIAKSVSTPVLQKDGSYDGNTRLRCTTMER